ncbi:MAG TPA: L-seryl-tRNA(Sec) selenium transferase [Myxococcaceae bacterium]|nr:L-seryl-tRNA(Sec) selenium transferase [Myxococcaceae bacterium]
MGDRTALLRSLPSIDELLSQPSYGEILGGHPRALQLHAARLAVDRARARLLRGEERAFDRSDLQEAVRALTTPNLRRVINATGVVLHTNLGRAPLAARAAARVQEVARGYSNLEYDLDEGERGSRYAPLLDLLAQLTGAESAVVVNNNAAAVLLVLSALARGKEAVVSRGELVEIGGGFRIPDVMAQSGAKLVEVGTTNRTRLQDYERAVTPDTAVLLKVHRSNFAVVGFTEEAAGKDLCALARAKNLLVFEDLGSGSLVPLEGEGLTAEPTVRDVVASGVDVVSFSGDKLLGGPQAGIIVGKKALMAQVKAHPLNRAVRVDKMTVAALEATLELYREERLAEVPTHRMLTRRPDDLRPQAERLQTLLAERGVQASLERTTSQVGGGAMPLAAPVSWACALSGRPALQLQERLRSCDPPVIARVSDEKLLLDVRCVEEEDLVRLAEAVSSVK